MDNIFGRKNRKNGFHFQCTDFLTDPECGIYVEDYFHEMIYTERKRSERSKRPFMLMLLDLEQVLNGPAYKLSLETITKDIVAMTRETDIKGWYRHHSVIGTIFTEITESMVETIKKKVYSTMMESGAIGPELFEKIKVSFHVYPEKKSDSKLNIPLDFKLYPDLVKKNSCKRSRLIVKRAIDICGAAAGLVIFSPLFVAIPLAIKMTSKGPVFFRQTRVGEFGKPFTFLKFRSMHIDNDEKIHSEYVRKLILDQKEYGSGVTGKIYKIKDDPRITAIGKFLRKTSLDELPQFLNVLRGDMSLVGPRPPIPYELENYDAWHWGRVREAKPGITGLWQVKGRSMTTFNDMVRMDIRYAKQWSIWMDLKLMALTPWSMLTSKGAY